MTWDAWAAIGQMVGAMGVIASLIFVGVQVRQSVRAAKAAAFQGLVSSIIEVNMALIDDPELLEAADQDRRGEPLSPSEHRLYVALVLTATRLAQSAHYQAQLGLLDKSKLESVVYNLVRHIKTATGQQVWSELALHSDPEFRDYMESLMAKSDSLDALLVPASQPA